MGLYDIDYTNLAYNLTPQTRRKPRFIAWIRALLEPAKWAGDLLFQEYANGSDAPVWQGFPFEYNTGEKVRSGFAIYESLIDENVDQVPQNSPGSWIKVCDDFRGVRERVLYNSQKIKLEYILNRWFGTNWVQPDSMTAPTRPDIYIDNNVLQNMAFTVYEDDTNSSKVFASDLFTEQFIMDDYDFIGDAFTIYVPAGFYAGLGTFAEAQIRAIADKYVIAGITYTIQTY
jgi:hypothetical protein